MENCYVTFKIDISLCCILNEKINKQLERKMASKDKRNKKKKRGHGNMQCLPGLLSIYLYLYLYILQLQNKEAAS